MNATEKVIPGDIAPSQCRAARALLDWQIDQLEAASGVHRRTLIRLERGQATTRSTTLAAIRAALEAAGVEFIAENGGGAGVRLKRNG